MHRIATLAALALFATPPPAVFGPPLLCQPFDIGSAKSLPFGADAFAVDPSFDRADLVKCTVAVLSGTDDPLVHLETMRRAAIYAAKFDDRAAGTRAFSQAVALQIHDRALRAVAAGKDDPLAWLDAGYLLEALGETESRPGISGREYVDKAVSLRPGDGAFRLAAGNVAIEHGDKAAIQAHYSAALANAPAGSLLHKNVQTFANRYLPHFLGKDSDKLVR